MANRRSGEPLLGRTIARANRRRRTVADPIAVFLSDRPGGSSLPHTLFLRVTRKARQPWNHVRFPTPYVEASVRKLSKIHETMPAAHRGKAARGRWFVQKQYTNRNRNLLRACWPNSSTMERRL